MQQQAPANFVKSLAVGSQRCQAELLVGEAPLCKTPKSFGPEVSVRTPRKSCEARLCLGFLAMLALAPAVARNRGASPKLPHQQECRNQEDASHWSSFSSTL